MKYSCPVCGYNNLVRDPTWRDYLICPSCGTEFGYDDLVTSHEELRQEWEAKGYKWWGADRLRPPN